METSFLLAFKVPNFPQQPSLGSTRNEPTMVFISPLVMPNIPNEVITTLYL